MKRRLHGQRGTTLPETAIIVAVLLALVFGIFEFGRALYTYNIVADLARKGARWAIVRGSLCTKLDSCPASADNIQTYVRSIAGPGLDSTSIVVAGAGAGASNTHGSPIWTDDYPGCMGTANAYNATGCTVNVTVSYPFSFMLPYLPSGGSQPCGGSTSVMNFCISSTSKMIIAQ